jgi:hypothetical protein
LCEHLLAVPVERLAYLLALAGTWVDPWDVSTTDLLVRAAVPVPDEALTVQTAVRVEVDPAFTRAILRECYERGLSLVDVHTHPFAQSEIAFSGHDMTNMNATHTEFASVVPQEPPAVAASIVLGHACVAGAWRDPATGRLSYIDELVLPSGTYDHLELKR